RLLFGHPWFGVLCTTTLMCAAICWMLQAWLPPPWALLGGLLAVLRLGLFSYWINTYFGAGSIVALGGALVLGALPRFIKRARFRDPLFMAVGVALLGISRPYDGLLLCLPVGVYLGRWIFRGKNRPSPGLLLRRTALPLALIMVAGAWMAYYDYRVFGNPLTLLRKSCAVRDRPILHLAIEAARTQLPAQRNSRVLLPGRTQQLQRNPQSLGLHSRDAPQGRPRIRLLCRYQSARPPDYGATSPSRSSSTLPHPLPSSINRWPAHRGLSPSSLPRRLYRRLLCHRPSGYASSAFMEARWPPSRPHLATVHRNNLCL